MHKQKLLILGGFFGFLILAVLSGILSVLIINGISKNPVQDLNKVNDENIGYTLTSGKLSSEEQNDLLYMREEEKLARDVYLTLYDKWGIRTFSNIAKSEERHTDTLQDLISEYDLVDPYIGNVGEFSNEELEALYTKLVEQGLKSEIDALKAGAMIEDLDIVDLNKAIDRTDNNDLIFTYNNLKKGSENHLRAFTNQIEQRGETYEPQFLTHEQYDEIITGENTGRNARGGNNRGGYRI